MVGVGENLPAHVPRRLPPHPLLIEYLGKFLLLERQFGDKTMLILPGGKVESFDQTQSEVIRKLNGDGEVYAELKIALPPVIDYFGSNLFVNTQEEQLIDVAFYAKFTERPEIIIDGTEVKSFTWMDQIQHIDGNDRIKKALKEQIQDESAKPSMFSENIHFTPRVNKGVNFSGE
jgi:hypothetical protein